MREENKEEFEEENFEEKEEEHEERVRIIVTPGEKIVSGNQYLPGEGTRREKDDIISLKFGLAEIVGKFVKVIPLSGTYLPRSGNTVIGRITDVTFNGWLIDVKAPYQAFLPVAEYPRFIRGDLSEFMDIGDMVACKIFSLKRKGIDLSLKGKGFGKLEGGMMMEINSNKVPRVIGREGSMIKIIKQETNCDVVVGQNGIIWIYGNSVDDELKAKEAILLIARQSFVDGLTDKVQEFLNNKNGKNKGEED